MVAGIAAAVAGVMRVGMAVAQVPAFLRSGQIVRTRIDRDVFVNWIHLEKKIKMG